MVKENDETLVRLKDYTRSKTKRLQMLYLSGILFVPMFYIALLQKFIENKLIYVPTKDLLEYIVYFLGLTLTLLGFFEKVNHFEKLEKKQGLSPLRKKYIRIESKIGFWWVATFITIVVLDIICRLLNFSTAITAIESFGIILGNLSPLILILSYIFEIDIKRKGYWSLFSFDSFFVKGKNNQTKIDL